MDLAIDMHLIPRWDGKKTADLTRSKMKSGTTWFERYITAQCVKAGSQITVAAAHMPALSDTAGFVEKVIGQCAKGGVRIRTILLDREVLLGRGHRGAGAGRRRLPDALPQHRTGWSGPSANSPRAGGRAVSTHAIRRSRNEYITYTMIIAKRRRRKSKKQASASNPEDVYIAFATNRPGIHLEKYARRWMIETGYRMIENQAGCARAAGRSRPGRSASCTRCSSTISG